MAHQLLIFDTHPIQYRSPVFQKLFERFTDFKVYFFNPAFDGKRWWFQEYGKATDQDFGMGLQADYETSVLNLNQIGFFDKVRLLSDLIKEEAPRSIVIYGYYQIEHWILCFLCLRKGIPLIFIGETYDWKGSLLRKLAKRILVGLFFKRVSTFVSVGKKTTDYYSSWGIDPSRIVEAKYCTDPEVFSVPEEEAEALKLKTRAILGIPDNAFVLLFVGRLFSRKRPQDLVRIHRRLSHLKELHTVIVGSGELFRKLVHEAKKEERLHVIGFRNQTELKDFYYASDLLIVPSEFETWGLVVNEAFSCGVPALVTEKCGVAHDLVIPGQTGEIFPAGKWEQAAEKIEMWVRDRRVLKDLGEQARNKVVGSYLPEHFSEKILEAFNRSI